MADTPPSEQLSNQRKHVHSTSIEAIMSATVSYKLFNTLIPSKEIFNNKDNKMTTMFDLSFCVEKWTTKQRTGRKPSVTTFTRKPRCANNFQHKENNKVWVTFDTLAEFLLDDHNTHATAIKQMVNSSLLESMKIIMERLENDECIFEPLNYNTNNNNNSNSNSNSSSNNNNSNSNNNSNNNNNNNNMHEMIEVSESLSLQCAKCGFGHLKKRKKREDHQSLSTQSLITITKINECSTWSKPYKQSCQQQTKISSNLLSSGSRRKMERRNFTSFWKSLCRRMKNKEANTRVSCEKGRHHRGPHNLHQR